MRILTILAAGLLAAGLQVGCGSLTNYPTDDELDEDEDPPPDEDEDRGANVDVDGDGAADFEIQVNGAGGLAASDLLL